MGIFYFLGRNMTLSNYQIQLIFKLILGIAFSAFCINLAEFSSGIHLHTLINYGNFQNTINDVEPTGNYGLSWTFETQSGIQRFGAFFANPLDLASASLLAFAIAFIFFIKTPIPNQSNILQRPDDGHYRIPLFRSLKGFTRCFYFRINLYCFYIQILSLALGRCLSHIFFRSLYHVFCLRRFIFFCYRYVNF